MKNYTFLNKLIILSGTSKPRFLILAFVCVFVGVAVAVSDGHHLNFPDLLLVITGALASHAAVNILNEYFDFRSGLDFKTVKTKFSGGSGSLQKLPEMAYPAFFFGLLNLVLVSLVGLFFIRSRGIIVLLPFIPGILSILFYTHFIVRKPFLCLFAPGIGFGFCMVMGVYIALTGSVSWAILVVSLVLFFLVNNLLLLNQFPDMDADRSIGRKNVVILYGKRKALHLYSSFMICTFLVIVIAAILKIIPVISLFSVFPIIFVLIRVGRMRILLEKNSNIDSLLGINVIAVLATPTLVATGLVLMVFENSLP